LVFSSAGAAVNKLAMITTGSVKTNNIIATYKKCIWIKENISFERNRSTPEINPTIIPDIAPDELALFQKIPTRKSATMGGTA
jgi:hypothetical protein